MKTCLEAYEELAQERDQLKAEVERLKAELEYIRTWASRTTDEVNHQSELRQQWHDMARELVNNGGHSPACQIFAGVECNCGRLFAIARFNAMEKGTTL